MRSLDGIGDFGVTAKAEHWNVAVQLVSGVVGVRAMTVGALFSDRLVNMRFSHYFLLLRMAGKAYLLGRRQELFFVG